MRLVQLREAGHGLLLVRTCLRLSISLTAWSPQATMSPVEVGRKDTPVTGPCVHKQSAPSGVMLYMVILTSWGPERKDLHHSIYGDYDTWSSYVLHWGWLWFFPCLFRVRVQALLRLARAGILGLLDGMVHRQDQCNTRVHEEEPCTSLRQPQLRLQAATHNERVRKQLRGQPGLEVPQQDAAVVSATTQHAPLPPAVQRAHWLALLVGQVVLLGG
jgi:hypothetical protein